MKSAALFLIIFSMSALIAPNVFSETAIIDYHLNGGGAQSNDPDNPIVVDFVDGGSCSGSFAVGNNATLNMLGGTIYKLEVAGYHEDRPDPLTDTIAGQINIYGGTFSGGKFDDIVLGHEGTITIFGSNFTIDGESIAYGSYQKEDFDLVLNDGRWDYFGGQISGTLASGEAIDNSFAFFHEESTPCFATLELAPAPEPATMLLFGLGGVLLRKRS